MLAKMMMIEKLNEFVARLEQKPEVEAILIHGGVTNNPRHECDFSSDLDLTVFVSKALPNWLPNFKFYVPFNGQIKYLEVDIYQFVLPKELDPSVIWCDACREGYLYSTEIVYDRTGKIRKLLADKCEITPEYRISKISNLILQINSLLELNEINLLDKNCTLTKAVNKLIECIFYINWEYPPDMKWRISGMNILKWLPSNSFFDNLEKTNQVTNPCSSSEYLLRRDFFENNLNAVAEKLYTESIQVSPISLFNDDVKKMSQGKRKSRICRLYTRLDKYSGHTVKKCIKRGFPWNAHDTVNEGICNVVDLIYFINNQIPPSYDKINGLTQLNWLPSQVFQQLYQSIQINNYEDTFDAKRRSDILRGLFLEIKVKIQDEGLFNTVSLYDDDFIDQDLFGINSPYMNVFKGKEYKNRQLSSETFAEVMCKKLASVLTIKEKNILFGLCNEYFLANEAELMSLNPSTLHQAYLPVWEKVKKFL